MKRVYWKMVVLLSTLALVACGGVATEREVHEESQSVSMDVSVPANSEESKSIEQSESYIVEPDAGAGEFDYEFYLQGIYMSADGNDNKIYIRPIQYIHEYDIEEIEKYGLEGVNWSSGHYILDNSEEIIALPINEETEFLIINWGHDQEMADNSVNHSTAGWCLIKDPIYFFQCMAKEYGQKLSSYPLFIIMGDDGYVDQVVELPLA